MVGGMAEGFQGGEVDLDDGEGGGVAAGVAEAEVGGVEGVELGFVHAGDVEEEGNLTPDPSPNDLRIWRGGLRDIVGNGGFGLHGGGRGGRG